MKNKAASPSDALDLRRRAEARLHAQPPGTGQPSEADTQRMLHELQVHQVELEMQNEELQQARDQMECALEKYSDLYDFAPVAYLTLDGEGIVREANLTSTSLLGIERSRLVPRRFGGLVAPADQPTFNAFLKRVFEGQARESCDVTLLPEGKPPVAVRLRAAVTATGRECRAVLTDITEHNRAEEDRLQLSKLESTGVLAGGIAHDFNNLLTVMLVNLDLAPKLAPLNEEVAQCLKEARNAALLGHTLTQQLITFAKGGAPVRKLIPLSPLIQNSIRLALSGSRVRCDYSLAEDLWPAEVDEGQIGQVIRNVALNAREAMPEGGVMIARAENVVLRGHDPVSLPPGDYVRVELIDQGGGMAKEMLTKIFDPYFSTKQRGDQKGMGLGLTICHTILQKHGGAIAVESKLGVGSTFHLYLPATQKPIGNQVAPVPKTLPQHGKILVMDDEEGVRKAVGRALRCLGLEVELAEDGQRAIEVYHQALRQGKSFDMVILDLTVHGGVGGQEAMQNLLKLDPAVKAVVMSGYADNPVVLKPEHYGFKGFLPKPFETAKLEELLARVLGAGTGQ
jgi:signal transduction histidine kinase/ActR/RegA family two-component response regulator